MQVHQVGQGVGKHPRGFKDTVRAVLVVYNSMHYVVRIDPHPHQFAFQARGVDRPGFALREPVSQVHSVRPKKPSGRGAGCPGEHVGSHTEDVIGAEVHA